MKRPTANHFGGCPQMLVDGRQRPLDDTWCFFLPCTGISWWVFAVPWKRRKNSAHENTYIETLHGTHTVRAAPSEPLHHSHQSKWLEGKAWGSLAQRHPCPLQPQPPALALKTWVLGSTRVALPKISVASKTNPVWRKVKGKGQRAIKIGPSSAAARRRSCAAVGL